MFLGIGVGLNAGSSGAGGGGAPEGSETIRPAFIASTAEVYGPTIVADHIVSPALIPSSTIVFEPRILGGGTIGVPRIESTAQVYQPTVVADHIVSPSRIESTAQVFSPSAIAEETEPELVLRSSAAAASTSITMPTHQAGDLLVMCATRGSSSLASLPDGWTSVDSEATTGRSIRLAYKWAASSSETSGTWTSGNGLHVWVFSGADTTTPFGAVDGASGAGQPASFPALTLQKTDGSSWVCACVFAASTSTNIEATNPTGMIHRSNRLGGSNESSGYDTNGGVSSWSAQTMAYTPDAAYSTLVFEVRAA